MAKAELNDDRQPWEAGQAIVAAWFKVLQRAAVADRKIKPEDTAELKRVFGEIFKTKVQLLVDPMVEADGVYMVVPQPPVNSAPELVEYIRKFHDDNSSHQFQEEMGAALIFGCGKR